MIKRSLQIFGLLLIIGFATFANALKNPMVIDDHAFFDEKMRNINHLWIQFVPDKEKALKIKDQKGDAYYRPLAHVIPMLSYLTFRQNVIGHHAVNVVLFAIASLMIVLFVFTLWRNWFLGVLAAVAYLVHPINGVMVNYITASVFSAQVIFMLAALMCLYFKRFIFSVLFFILALMCHETAMALPFYAFAMIFVLRERSLKLALKETWPLWAFLIVYFFMRLKFASLHHSILGNFEKFHMNVFEYGASMIKLTYWYLSKLFYPVGIVLIKAMPVVREGVWLWLGAGVGMGAILALYIKAIWHRPVALLGLAWFIIGFLPYTQACLFRPSHGLMLEPHWFIFPLVGFFIWLADLLLLFGEKYKRKWVKVLIPLLFIAWIFSSWGMNKIWSDEVLYCRYWLSQSPNFSSVMFYLGKAYELRDDYVNARLWYEKGLAEGYRTDMILTNLGLLDIMESRWDLAKEHLSLAVKQNPLTAIAWSNLGTVAFVEKDYTQAKEYFLKAIEIDPFAMLPRLNLAKTFEKLEEPQNSLDTYKAILKIVPHEEVVWVNVLKLQWSLKDEKGVLDAAKKLLMISRNPETLTNVGIMMQHFSRNDLAVQAYRKAIAADKSYLKAHQLLERLK